MAKEIWLPKSETKVTVSQEGKVLVWQEMLMHPKRITAKPGFESREDNE